MHRLLHRFLRDIAVSLLTLFFLPGVYGAELEDSLGVVSKTNRSDVASQEKIDELSRETQGMLEEYRKLLDGSEYQADYTRELEELDRTQRTQIEGLQEQIAQARITRQRIVPLMRSMALSTTHWDRPIHCGDGIALARPWSSRNSSNHNEAAAADSNQ